VVGIRVVHPDVVVTHGLLWLLLRMEVVSHERMPLAGQGLCLLVRDPLLAAFLVAGSPVGDGPERVHGPAFGRVVDECDDGSDGDLQGDDQGEEPPYPVGPAGVVDDPAVGWRVPEINGNAEDGN
jgi:hypothetical protein